MTERLGPPPVENLSDFAWARVERSIWARMDNAQSASTKHRRVWPWLVVPAIISAAIAIVILAMPDSDPKATSVATVDEEPTRVVSGASPSTVTFGDAHVALEADTALVMNREATRPTVMLEHGTAWFTVAPRGERPPFVVVAGDALVRVIGTRFRVARSEEHVDVQVDHGIVEVAFRGTHVRLEANQRWSSDPSSEIDMPEQTLPPARGSAKHHAAKQVAPKQPPPAAEQAPQAELDEQTRYNALVKLETSHPDAAMKGYLELSRGGSKWSAVALFAAGRLAADRHDPRAQTFLSIYLRRFADGANATDARELLTHLNGETP